MPRAILTEGDEARPSLANLRAQFLRMAAHEGAGTFGGLHTATNVGGKRMQNTRVLVSRGLVLCFRPLSLFIFIF